MKIEMIYENQINDVFSKEENYLNIAEKVFSHLKLDDYFIFELDLVSIETIHQINRDYRNVDRPTDVISFAFEDDNDFIAFKGNNDFPRDLGQILICVDIAKKQAIEYNHSLEREMYFLFVHGLLHLLGYDHIKKEDETVMFNLQDEIMDILGL